MLTAVPDRKTLGVGSFLSALLLIIMMLLFHTEVIPIHRNADRVRAINMNLYLTLVAIPYHNFAILNWRST